MSRSLAVLLLAAVAHAAGGSRADAPARDAAPSARAGTVARGTEERWAWRGAASDEHRAIGAWLRAERAGAVASANAAAAESSAPDARTRVTARREAALAPLLDVLVQGRVPAASADDAPQKLSEPQRALLLELVAAHDVATIRAALQARLAAGADADVQIAALRVFGAVGEARDLARLASIAPRTADDTLTSGAREALRSAYAGILTRSPDALDTAGALVEALDESAASELLVALADRRDPRAIVILFRVARRNSPSLAQTAIAMVPRIGSSHDADVDAEFASWLVNEIHPDKPEWTRTVVGALGELDDGDAVPALIALLAHAHKGVADASLAALRRSSGLAYPAQAALWQAWYDRELKWHERERPRQRNALDGARITQTLEALRAYSQHTWHRSRLASDVCRALTRREAPVRELACEILAGIGARSAVPALVETLGDDTRTVAAAAWRALQRITGAELPQDREAWRAFVAAPPRASTTVGIAR